MVFQFAILDWFLAKYDTITDNNSSLDVTRLSISLDL